MTQFKLLLDQESMGAKISIDLLGATKRELQFIQLVNDNAKWLYDEKVVREAIRRYETLWLPALAANPKISIIPPLDIHWIWHTHMLAPIDYQKDCLSICNSLIDHKMPDLSDFQSSEKQWESLFPNEPYNFKDVTPTEAEYIQRSGYDLEAAVQRKKGFHLKVSDPIYNEEDFLVKAVKRYLMFLRLCQAYKGKKLTPFTDFDLVWHAHQVHPMSYLQECLSIFGHLINHNDDIVNDPNKHSTQKGTVKLWSYHFTGEPYSTGKSDRSGVPGCGSCNGGCNMEKADGCGSCNGGCNMEKADGCGNCNSACSVDIVAVA